MQQRIKVSDFYKQLVLAPLVELNNILQAFLTEEALFALSSNSNHISRYCLRRPEIFTLIPLPQRSMSCTFPFLQSLVEFGSMVCYCLKGQENIWCFSGNTLSRIQAHFAPITALARLSTDIYSSSEDLAIRVWNIQSNRIVPNASKHALTGHTGTINCLVAISSMLLSGSEDKSVTVWQSNEPLTSKIFSSPVQNLFWCESSSHLCVQEKEGTISIIDLQRLRKQKALIVSRQVEGLTLPALIGISEIDASFALAIGQSSIEVVELNLGSVVGNLKVGSLSRLLAVKAIRRLVLVTIQNRGLCILKL